jgi:phosphatidylserine/phosphatidylglycerophosphate/cardiolipin synthase-like enzyme
LLTDREAGDLNGATVQRLAQRGPVRSLRGLHGKVYIVDDLVLLTSANLTRTAFSKRYEVGVWLRGSLALEAIKQYEKWWEDIRSGQLKPEDLAQIVKNRRADAGEDEGSPLVVLNSLPNDPTAGSSMTTKHWPKSTPQSSESGRKYLYISRLMVS